MLRCQPSQVALTRDDIDHASLRVHDRKKTASARPPPSLRLSVAVSPQRATIRRGPERSRDDAVIHHDHRSALHPHSHAEYVSLRHSCTGTNQHPTKDRAARRESDGFSDSAGSISISSPSSPALHYDTRQSRGHRVCANPLAVLGLAPQEPAAKDTSIPLSSSPNLPRHVAIHASRQGFTPIPGHSETYPRSDLPENPWPAWETLAHQFIGSLDRGELDTLPSFLRTHKSQFPETETADSHLIKYMSEYFRLDYPTPSLTPIPYDAFRSIVEHAITYRITLLNHDTLPREVNRDSAEYVVGDSAAPIIPRRRAQRTNHGSAVHAAEDNTASPLELLQYNLRGLQSSVASIRPERPISEHFEPFHQQMRPISHLPRSRTTPATTLQDQENSEFAAMSVLFADVRRLQARNTSPTDSGILDDTPQRATRLVRHLQG